VQVWWLGTGVAGEGAKRARCGTAAYRHIEGIRRLSIPAFQGFGVTDKYQLARRQRTKPPVTRRSETMTWASRERQLN